MSETTKRIVLRTTVTYLNRTFEVEAEGYTFDELCDLLDRRGADSPAVSQPPICPTHNKPMKPMQKPDRAGRSWWCTCKVGDGYCQERG